jgi:hypothetical protein
LRKEATTTEGRKLLCIRVCKGTANYRCLFDLAAKLDTIRKHKTDMVMKIKLRIEK